MSFFVALYFTIYLDKKIFLLYNQLNRLSERVINIDVNKSLGFQLSKIAQEMDWRFSELLKEYQINSRDYGILLAISNKEELTQINVGDLLKIDRTTIGQLIDCLEMKGLIFRKRNPQDRRQNIVLLTDSGRELVETMWLKMLGVEKEVLNDLSGIQEKVILDIAQFIKEKNNG